MLYQNLWTGRKNPPLYTLCDKGLTYNYFLLPAGNAKMMSFQSLIQHLNLKALVNSLNLAHQQTSLPYFVLKVANRVPMFPEHSSLSLSYTSNYLDDKYPLKA